MIRGVLFDYGGVVAEGGKGINLVRRLGTELGMPEDQAIELLLPLWQQMTRGTLSTDRFWEKVSEHLGHGAQSVNQNMWDHWWSVELYPEMAAVIASLKQHNYQVGLLSNIVPSAATAIRKSGGYDSFDFAILSCEVGYAKPDPEIYALALAHFENLQPAEIVFIDDQEKCMPPAASLGMQTILATSTDQIISELRQLGLPV